MPFHNKTEICTEIVEYFKTRLIGAIPANHPSVSVIKAEPRGRFSIATADTLRNVIPKPVRARLANDMDLFYKSEFDEPIEYSNEDKIYAKSQKDRLIEMLETSL